jgi:hypothetical protein
LSRLGSIKTRDVKFAIQINLWLANNTNTQQSTIALNTQQSTIALSLFIAKEGVGVMGAKALPIRRSQGNNNFHHKRDLDDSEHNISEIGKW